MSSTSEELEDYFLTNFDLWYNALESVTFKSQIIELTEKQILSFIYNNLHFNEFKEEIKNLNLPLLTQEEITMELQYLENKTNQLMASSFNHCKSDNNNNCKNDNYCKDKFYFIKLSCRSPKDAFAMSDKLKHLFKEKCKYFDIDNTLQQDNTLQNNNNNLQQKLNENFIINEKLKFIYESMIESMKIKEFKEAYFYLQNSYRILEDFILYFKQKQQLNTKQPKMEMKLIIREWIDIPLCNEFRCFIYNDKLRAISQYYDVCYFKELQQNKNEIKDKLEIFINEKVNNLLKNSKLQNNKKYICDLAIGKDGNIYVIELNPYSDTTDTCLFSWKRDEKVLKESEHVEFRIREKELKKEQLKHEIISIWIPLLFP
ncbi:hypothetical protein ABK040_004599 [Willaertia magna]